MIRAKSNAPPGVVLTGANADGARGLARIVELGGRAIVQDPDGAERDGDAACSARRGARRRASPPVDGIASLLVEPCGLQGCKSDDGRRSSSSTTGRRTCWRSRRSSSRSATSSSRAALRGGGAAHAAPARRLRGDPARRPDAEHGRLRGRARDQAARADAARSRSSS